ncbi:MAG: D-glycero-beta-D-manno-heptose 1-phosphate adenylyltransferase [Sporocytophaga sp.]|uniref:D-glycero-beta-D-manno-heptose 1-phosphate adenylyltransferase n=1 Tax=Sporocytophaga sp. TaxID=2231183 RepID=UPI001B0E1127|nr:D-glycero-beta-D-manno-heptose 1-phosphate adenylyltransferase [Sporocytophaga sp.]MBO9698988.1 D-glycero-beta-D-manno-heptose 1-phosphate adenylyltransferase [Sporocytophaga sp.]
MTSDKIQTWDTIIPEVKSWKERGEKVVFTNGCFDILHLGHADYLEKSRSLGDRLIVGLNTDASVRKLKGPERPVNPEYARARILAALEFVDAVILFDEDTPFELISHVIPDILVKGDDYKIENIVGADIVMKHGGEVKTISLVDGFSTTGIIGKIKTHNK